MHLLASTIILQSHNPHHHPIRHPRCIKKAPSRDFTANVHNVFLSFCFMIYYTRLLETQFIPFFRFMIATHSYVIDAYLFLLCT